VGTTQYGFASALAALAAASFALPAFSLQQPDGTVIPARNTLVNALVAAGEPIDPLTEANTTPETFKPSCRLTFTVLARGAGQRNSFGWYNVTGQKPTFAELVEFITCTDGVGAVKVLDIQQDPRYRGGEVGFFEATTEGYDGLFQPNCVNFANPAGTLGHLFYSQKQFNEDNNPGGASYVHLLIMDSKTRPNAFYFGWEDLFQGGDNDFEDLLTRVEGVQCSGGGEACDTTKLGPCGVGAVQCVNGVLTCVERQFPQTESCNAVDDDCDGQTDDGDVCPPSQICDRGTCVAGCGGGEFTCPPGLTCRADGFCVDSRCENVSCSDGQICVAGECKAACDGVKCPFGKLCRAGICLDACAGVTCDPGQICESGVCVSCDCGGCPDGRVCNGPKTQCVAPGCETATCSAGQHCETGVGCVDDCAGAVCPFGQVCVAGNCVAGSAPDGGGSSSGGTGGIPIGGSGGAAGSSGSSGSSATTGGGAGEPSDYPGRPVGESKGCSCRVVARGGQRTWLVAPLLALLALRRRKRRTDLG
jgi:MYXO-CTERM domain-containing protein